MGAAVSAQSTHVSLLAAVPLAAVWCEVRAGYICVPVCASLGAVEFGDG